MRVLVAFASKHGATEGIAARIAAGLRRAGHDVDLLAADAVSGTADYGAFVLGSATYVGHWRKEALALVERLETQRAGRPVWLFSSGPLGDDETDEQGRDVRASAAPRELPDLLGALRVREHRVFFGALDPSTLTLPEKAMRTLPAGKALLPEGDFRDWDEIDEWAGTIAAALTNGTGGPSGTDGPATGTFGT
jgi:menaquinone-dependent protoporphyrinogen oxidase